MMPSSASQPAPRGVFGYLPGHGDFVRVHADGREVRALADWIEQGLHQACWEMGGGFSDHYAQLFHRFVFRPDNCERAVVGVLAASMDNHQRPFPFAAFELIETDLWDRDPVALACRNEDFFASLESLIREVGPLPTLGQVHGRVLAQRASLLRELGGSLDTEADAREEARYENFLNEVTCANLGVQGRAPGARICSDLVGLLGAVADARQLRYALELPLSQLPYARRLELRFFLSLCRALCRKKRPTWTLFWQIGGTGSSSGSVMLSLRPPTIDLFAALLRGDGRARGVVTPGTASEPLESARLGPQLEIGPQTTLSALLAAVSATSSDSLVATIGTS